jgi:dTDP-4-amino-4,6-dideoxygalactose transaminase
VATTHALNWNGIKPIFCDIEPEYLNLDPDKIESAINPRTTAILPVHVYGSPCKVEEIQRIADTYGLKLIYDAAHAFDVKINGSSICNYGDLTILSFHATKVFTTCEGGAIVCHDEKIKNRIDFLKNFGFADEVTVIAPGINAKMNEMQAALGLLQLKEYEKNREKREEVANHYKINLIDIDGIRFIGDIKGVKHNYSYFPIFVDENKYGKSRDELYEEFKRYGVYCRRYFYPLISQLPTYRSLDSANSENLTIAEQMTRQVICLPIFPDLKLELVDKIIEIIKINFR